MKRNIFMAMTIASSLSLTGCSGMTVINSSELPVPAAATQEQSITGGATPMAATPIDIGTRYRINMDTSTPGNQKQYLKIHISAISPIEQRLRVVNLSPNKEGFAGYCSAYEHRANLYSFSQLKLGGAWKVAGAEGRDEKKIDLSADVDIVFEVVAQSGVGYLEIDLERYY